MFDAKTTGSTWKVPTPPICDIKNAADLAIPLLTGRFLGCLMGAARLATLSTCCNTLWKGALAAPHQLSAL